MHQYAEALDVMHLKVIGRGLQGIPRVLNLDVQRMAWFLVVEVESLFQDGLDL